VRVVHVAFQTGTVDVCLAPAGSTKWTGPLLASLGVAGGVDFAQGTRYVPLDPGSYDAILVAPGGACTGSTLGAKGYP
jgi:hypothetical protein